MAHVTSTTTHFCFGLITYQCNEMKKMAAGLLSCWPRRRERSPTFRLDSIYPVYSFPRRFLASCVFLSVIEFCSFSVIFDSISSTLFTCDRNQYICLLNSVLINMPNCLCIHLVCCILQLSIFAAFIRTNLRNNLFSTTTKRLCHGRS